MPTFHPANLSREVSALQAAKRRAAAWFEFIVERRFASVSVAIRPQKVPKHLQTGVRGVYDDRIQGCKLRIR